MTRRDILKIIGVGLASSMVPATTAAIPAVTAPSAFRGIPLVSVADSLETPAERYHRYRVGLPNARWRKMYEGVTPKRNA